jgi:integrase
LSFGAPNRERVVLGPTKTYARRTVLLPRFLVDLLDAMAPADRCGLVFTDSTGGALRHSNFYRRSFRPAVERAGLPAETRFHDLRHTCAAPLIARGAHPLAIKERLGHSSVTVTIDTYGGLFPSVDEALAEGLEATYRLADSAKVDRRVACMWPEGRERRVRSV